MKKISIIVPAFNEEENVKPLAEVLTKILHEDLSSYDYELIFIDNCSTDRTREILLALCAVNPKIKAIFNAKNFGQMRSPFHALLQSSGDVVISMCADFQDPPELITQFIKKWENGVKIVTAVKEKSKENPLMYLVRSVYYWLIQKISHSEHIKHFTGFGLYDRSFIDVLRKLDDPDPYLRGIVGELGFKREDIFYEQQKRKAGKSKNNWYSLYDVAMMGITSYSKLPLRFAVFFGFMLSGISLTISLVYLILKIVWWDTFSLGLAPLVIGVFFLGSIQLFFIGLLGEYILNINTRILNRPLVVEEQRINF